MLPQKKSIEKAIEMAKKPHKSALQKLSMVLRKIGKTKEEVLMNTKTSIVKAKEAVALDVSDGDSWYVLGNAHLAHFFFDWHFL